MTLVNILDRRNTNPQSNVLAAFFNKNFGKPSLQSFEKTCYFFLIGHVNIGIIFYLVGNFQSCINKTRSISNWLSKTQSNVLQADWLMLKNNEKATLNINMLYNHKLQN